MIEVKNGLWGWKGTWVMLYEKRWRQTTHWQGARTWGDSFPVS
jgi:hypothetical protein